MMEKISLKTPEEEVLVINVGGVQFETAKETLLKLPNTKLADADILSKHYRPTRGDYFFDRNPQVFAAILNYYRVGELHLPTEICCAVVIQELHYWGVSEDCLEQCCWLKLCEHLDRQTTLEKLDRSPILIHSPQDELNASSVSCSCWRKWQPRIWTFLEDPYSSKAAKVFAFFSALVVLVSLVTLCMETHPHFRGNLTAEHYAEIYHVPKRDIMLDWGILKDHYYDDELADMFYGEEEDEEEEIQTTVESYVNDEEETNSTADNVKEEELDEWPLPNSGSADFLEDGGQSSQGDPGSPPRGPQRRKRDTTQSRAADRLTLEEESMKQSGHLSPGAKESRNRIQGVRIVQNPLQVTKNGKKARREKRNIPGEGNMELAPAGGPNGKPPSPHGAKAPPTKGPAKYTQNELLSYTDPVFEMIDYICHAFFTFELLLRFIFCPNKWKFFLNPLNLVDLVSIIPFYVETIVNSINSMEKYQQTSFDTILVFRVVRVFRIIRLGRHYRGLQVLAFTVKASLREMFLMMVFLSIGMIMFSSLIYYADMDTFQSIPGAFWWAIVTMTTVGYGDMVPKSSMGYLVGSLCTISGVLVIAFTVPVIVGNFMMFYQAVEYGQRRRDTNREANANAKVIHKVSRPNPTGQENNQTFMQPMQPNVPVAWT